MQVFGLNRCFARLAKYSSVELCELSEKAVYRWKALELWRRSGDVALTMSTFEVSRSTLYRWRDQCNLRDPGSLEEQSRRPKNTRGSQWPTALEETVYWLRDFSGWGKDKLAPLVQQLGFQYSVSTVGRVLEKLKRSGRLKEPVKRRIWAMRRRSSRPWAEALPKDYHVEKPGDLVQIDTMDTRLDSGDRRKQFNCCDVISRWDVSEPHTRAKSQTAARFIDTVQAESPFPIRAFQIDGGPEFMDKFEAECQRRGIRLFLLPPRSPQLNGCVERLNRTVREEYYQRYMIPQSIEQQTEQVKQWQFVYNCIRPHQSLGFKTPLQVLADFGIVPEAPPPSVFLSQMS